MSETTRRLADLLIDLHETLDLEIKGWIDLSTTEHQAKVAKAVIAMANHGGGYVVFGFDEKAGMPAQPSPERPTSLSSYDHDRINGITEKYLDPAVHCSVHHVAAPDGLSYPVIVVPGGHRSPVMAKRDGPTGGELKQRATYIRRAGPKSEEPRTAQEMAELFDRCFSNRRDEVRDLIRTILSGGAPVAAPSVSKQAVDLRLASWIADSRARWETLVSGVAASDPRRFPLGQYMISYELRGPLRTISAATLLDIMRLKTPRHTGWPPFWVPTRPEIAPYPQDGAIECWLGSDGERDAAHSDFWRVAPDGRAFLLRGYQEDGPDVEQQGFAPGTVFDITLPIWRVGEALLHAQALSAELSEGDTEVALRIRYSGLQGRSLTSISRTRLMFEGRHKCRQDTIDLDTTVPVALIAEGLPEILYPLIKPLYELFDFFQISPQIVQEEATKMKSGRF